MSGMRSKGLSFVVFAAAGILSAEGLWLLVAGTENAGIPVIGMSLLAAGAALVWLYTGLRRAEERHARTVKEQMEQELRHHWETEDSRAAAKKEMDNFRDSLAHSLRMPVSVIQGYAELLAGGMVTDEETCREYLEKIVRCSEDLSEAVSRQFSMTESHDSKKLSYGDVDLLSLVRRLTADMKLAAAAKQVLIQVVASEHTMPIRVDAYHLSRMIFNLLENSLKYMGRPGSITIRLRDQGEDVEILVQDDGMGLPAHETAHVFEPNFQGSNHVGGRGYGLFQVQQSVLAHGGTISARSDLGKGMGITVILPKHPEKETADC